MDFLDQINSKRAELAKTQVKISDTKLKLEKTTMESERRILSQLLELYADKVDYLEQRIINLLAIMDGEP